ncbi:MAG: hypothetical protein PHO26_05640 [Dehalococcoidia bacterium]|nr:hypothetical protein [Dehalococcoidia bacterium]
MKRLYNYPEYVYKVENIRGRTITYEARTIRPGQLPLPELNRPAIKIKPRDEYIFSRKLAEKSVEQTTHKLPPDVKVHHTIIKPPHVPSDTAPRFIPGETIHHELRPLPQTVPVFKKAEPDIKVHHTIENSPGYIRSQSRKIQPAQSGIIHHTLQSAPGAQIGNPVRIERPVRIIEHHTLNTNPTLPGKGPLIPPPIRKNSAPGRNNEPNSRRR